jgi:DNA-binding response OmpR family regulator
MRLLLVEDDQILGSSLQKALEKHAYGVDLLEDGESALAALEDLSFAAVILDINLRALIRRSEGRIETVLKSLGISRSIPPPRW